MNNTMEKLIKSLEGIPPKKLQEVAEALMAIATGEAKTTVTTAATTAATTEATTEATTAATNIISDRELQAEISNTLQKLGISANLDGYKYLREAIKISVRDPKKMKSLTKTLYPTVASTFGVEWQNVERAIRHAIEVAFDRGDVDFLSSYFGYTVDWRRGKARNGEFIALLVDKLRLKYF